MSYALSVLQIIIAVSALFLQFSTVVEYYGGDYEYNTDGY